MLKATAWQGLIYRVKILYAPDFKNVIKAAGTFDIRFLNGVIEHIPLTAIWSGM